MARARVSPPSWLLSLLACPQLDCGGALAPRRMRAGSGLLGCRACGMVYPVLAGVPVVVAEPHVYCASYREALIASLAEHGALDRAALEVVDAFAASASGAEPRRFGDDWTGPEVERRWPGDRDGEAGQFAAFVAAVGRLEDRLARLAPAKVGVALELGCGDGELARRLAGRARRYVVADLSLRAVLRARAVAGRVAGCVLDQPLALPGQLAAALRPGGSVLLSTPDPELGGDDAAALGDALARAGLPIELALDRQPWLRLHPPREAQVFFCLVLLARRRAPRIRLSRAGRSRTTAGARGSRARA